MWWVPSPYRSFSIISDCGWWRWWRRQVHQWRLCFFSHQHQGKPTGRQRTTVEGKRTSKCSLHWTRSPSCLHCFFVFVADNRLLTTADAVASAPHATGTSKSANIIFPIVAVSRLYLQYATVVVRPHPVFPDSPRNWGCTGVMHLHTSPAGWQRGQSKWCLPTTACTFSTCRCLMAFVVHPIMYTNDGPYRQSSKEGAAGGQAKQLLAKEKGGGGLRGMLSSARSLAWGRRKGGAGVRGEEEDNRVSEQDCLFGQLGELSQVRPGHRREKVLDAGGRCMTPLTRLYGSRVLIQLLSSRKHRSKCFDVRRPHMHFDWKYLGHIRHWSWHGASSLNSRLFPDGRGW